MYKNSFVSVLLLVSANLMVLPDNSVAQDFECVKTQTTGFRPGDDGPGGDWYGYSEVEDEFNRFLEIRQPNQDDINSLSSGNASALFDEEYYPYVVVNPAANFILVGCKNGFTPNGILVCDAGKMRIELIFNSNNYRFNYVAGRNQFLLGEQASAAVGYAIGFCQEK